MMSCKKGIALTEVMIAIALFAIVASVAVGMMYAGATSTKQGAEYVVAAGLLQEGSEAVRSIRWRDYAEIVNGTHGLQISSGYFEFNGTSESLLDGVYTRTITVEDVYRDGSGDIADSGTLDTESKRVTVNVTWDTLEGKTQNVDTVFYVYDFNFVQSWTQTTLAEFNLGSFNSSVSQAVSGNGEVVAQSIIGDWTSVTEEYTMDISGTGDPEKAFYDAAQDILYIGTNNTSGDEFVAYDVSDVTDLAPTLIDGYEVGGSDIYDFTIANGYAYIATDANSEEVLVVRLSDMTNVNTINIEGDADAYSVAVTGTELIVGRDRSGDEEVYFYDISDPEGTLTETGSTEINEDCDHVDTDGSYAYCGTDDNSEEIIVIRLSNDSEVNTENLSGDANVNDVLVVGTSLYVARDNGGSEHDFYQLDISSPESSISVTDSMDNDGDMKAIAIDADEEFAYLATEDGSEELIIIDLSTFTQSTVHDLSGGDDAEAIAFFGEYVYVLTVRDGEELNILNTGSGGWGSPQLVGSDDKSGSHNGEEMYVDGNYAYLATSNSGSDDEFFIYDISTPSSPTLLGSMDLDSVVYDVVVSGNYAYLATSDNNRELDVIDISTKSSPSRAGSYNLSGGQNAYAIDIVGSYVYLGRDSNGSSGRNEIEIFDVSTPASPSIAGSLNYGSDVNDLRVSGDYLYAATDNNSEELVVIDISNPASPTEVGNYDLSTNTNGNSIDVSGSVVVLGRESSGSVDEINIFDVSTPSSPVLDGSANTDSVVNDIFLDGTSVAYIGIDTNNEEFQVWDISTTSSPSRTSVLDADADVKGIYYTGTYAVLATEHDSLELQIVGPASAPADYAEEATFTSQAFDSTGSGTSWEEIDWSLSGTGSASFRIRTASTELGLDSALWVGSDGTESTSYTVAESTITTDPGATGTQWVQWKVYLSGNGSTTPALEDVTLTYSP